LSRLPFVASGQEAATYKARQRVSAV